MDPSVAALAAQVMDPSMAALAEVMDLSVVALVLGLRVTDEALTWLLLVGTVAEDPALDRSWAVAHDPALDGWRVKWCRW